MKKKHLMILAVGLPLVVISAFANGQHLTNTAQNNTPKLVPMPPPLKIAPVQIQLEGPLSGDEAKSGLYVGMNAMPVTGRVIYALDTAKYGAAGFQWPWESYLTWHSLKKGTDSAPAATSYRVIAPPHQFVFEPQFSPDGKQVCFKVGDPYNSMGTFSVLMANLATGQFKKIPQETLSQRLLVWSPDSRYIAYLKGGQRTPTGRIIPSQLHIYDAVSTKEKVIAKSRIVPDSMAWSASNRLLYSAFPDVKEIPLTDSQAASMEVADVYSFEVTTAKNKLLFKNGFRSRLSPNGRKVAFLAMPDAEKLTSQATRTALFISNIDETEVSQRQMIQTLQRSKDIHILWFQDSQRLLLLQEAFKQGRGLEISVSELEGAEQKLRKLGVITIRANSPDDLNGPTTAFKPLQVSRDGKHLLFQSTRQQEKEYKDGSYIESFDLSSGKVSPVAGVGTGSGLDWHEG